MIEKGKCPEEGMLTLLLKTREDVKEKMKNNIKDVWKGKRGRLVSAVFSMTIDTLFLNGFLDSLNKEQVDFAFKDLCDALSLYPYFDEKIEVVDESEKKVK